MLESLSLKKAIDMNRIKNRLTPMRIIALGFVAVILIGSLLLYLPISHKEGASPKYIDTLYTSTSAVCVTGLIAIDAYDNFSLFGQIVLAFLIQIGGLGVTAVGSAVILAVGKKINLRGRSIIREAMNLGSGKGVVRFIKSVIKTTFIIELCGALLSFIVFSHDYSMPRAIWISIFHSIAAFNNSGFDILGGMRNLTPYKDNILLNVTTMLLIILGGIGFLVIQETINKHFRWKKFSMHTKVVISVSFMLIVVGALGLIVTEGFGFLSSVFHSVSARTAGFSTISLSTFSNAGLLLLIVLMFIGASPGSTGGGIKTTTFFVLLEGIRANATNRSDSAYKYSIAEDAFRKSSVIALLGVAIVTLATFLLTIFEPNLDLIDILFEVVSAFATVGLSTGITPTLSIPSKLVSILVMYIGRLGPLTVASIWHYEYVERIKYPEGNIAIG